MEGIHNYVLTTPGRGAYKNYVSVTVVRRVYIIMFSPHQTVVLTITMSVSVTVVRRVYIIMFSPHQTEELQ